MDIVKFCMVLAGNQNDLINHVLLLYKTMIFQCRKNVNLLTMKKYKFNIGGIITAERGAAH